MIQWINFSQDFKFTLSFDKNSLSFLDTMFPSNRGNMACENEHQVKFLLSVTSISEKLCKRTCWLKTRVIKVSGVDILVGHKGVKTREDGGAGRGGGWREKTLTPPRYERAPEKNHRLSVKYVESLDRQVIMSQWP